MPLMTRLMRLREVLVALGAALVTATVGAQCVDVQGDPAQGGMIWGEVPPQAAVSLDGEGIDVLPDGHFVAGFGRDAGSRSRLVVEVDGERCDQPLDVAARDYRIQRVEGVPQRTVTPPPEQLERIRRERALVAQAKRQRVERPEWLLQVDGGFDWPATGRISGVYGSQRFYNGTPGSPHYGVDVAVPTGTPVVAPAAGIVTLAEDDLFYSGGTVILDHGYQLSSSFLHMSRVLVSVGDELERGDLIGEVGATGRATGPHLDWRMSWRQERVDPQRLVPAMPAP